MRRALVLLLLLLVSCESGHDDDDLQFERVGLPDCQGSIPIQELPIERALIYSNRLHVEYDGERVSLRTEDGYFLIAGMDTGQGIEFEAYSYFAQIESLLPLRYAEIDFNRMAYLEGDVLTIEDRFNSYGDDLTCWHQFTMDYPPLAFPPAAY